MSLYFQEISFDFFYYMPLYLSLDQNPSLWHNTKALDSENNNDS